jgi:myo-inositol 2-dehydrogenase / D-chiro-inositol 1-dehydrogenase
MGSRFRIAAIGAGDMGNRHVEGWQLAGHDVVSVVDSDRARAQDVARRYRVPRVYTEYADASPLSTSKT